MPSLEGRVSLFIPELPGYGISTPSKQNSRMDIGKALLEALQTVFSATPNSPRKIVLGGHDRGARICHRLAVSRADFPSVAVIGAVLLDILPTKAQWENFSNPLVSQAYFHWPLLANVDLAMDMLTAFGGANWCRRAHYGLKSNEEGKKRIDSDGAVEIYASLFDKAETLRYSCEDYAAGAAPECAEQAKDQKAGRKIDVPTMVMFSQANLGRMCDVAEEWQNWIAPDVDYEAIAIGEGYGHFLPEEAYDLVSQHVLRHLQKFE